MFVACFSLVLLGLERTPPTPEYDARLGWTRWERSFGTRTSVVGDSWAWGLHVNANEAWPALVGATNAAVSGYGYDQAVLKAESLAADRVLVALSTDDVRRCGLKTFMGASKPYFMGAALISPGPRARLLDRTVFRARTQQINEPTGEDAQEIAVRLTRRLARRSGAALVLYRWAADPDVFALVRGEAARVGLRCVDVGAIPRGMFTVGDSAHHPNAVGHRYIARRVAEALNNNATLIARR
jgi:hypothetical protein